MTVDIGIIIPAKNEERNIARCLEAVFAQKTRYSFEVIIIDSGSTDGTARVASDLNAKVIKIRAEDFDHGRTRNLGFENSTGKYLVALVADAMPENEHWLNELVAPLDADENIAGAYSRQVPPEDIHPLASARFAGLDPSRSEPEVRSWPGDEIWNTMSPMDKLELVEFDDVSSVRRRSVWEKIPVAENYWAEDVDWSLKALRAGYKIAYSPGSVVRHGHKPSLRHDFKRAFVDQREALNRFGILLYANARESFDSWKSMVARDWRALGESDLETGSKIYWSIISPLRRFLEILGGYLAGVSVERENVYKDLYRDFIFTRRRGDLRKTVFSLGGKRCNTVFAHPPGEWRWKVRAAPGAVLEFMAGIHPDAQRKTGPVKFEVDVEGIRMWNGELDPAGRPEDCNWKSGEVELKRWEGKRVEITMRTDADNCSNAWAGWGEPRVRANRASLRNRYRVGFARTVERLLTKTPPRHP